MRNGLAAALLCLLWTGVASGTGTKLWTADTASELLEGTGQGVAVTEDGRLVPVPLWHRAVGFEEPILMAGDVDRDGAVLVGTGHPARLYRVRGASAELLAEVPAQQVNSLRVGPDGAAYLATVGPAAVFRWDGDELVEIGRLEQGGVWDLEWFQGGVVAAAGSPAALYRVARRGLERWVELPDAHARCLAATRHGLLVGTSGKGLVLRVTGEGGTAVLTDSPFTEISDLVPVPDGSVWVVAVVGEPVQASEKESKDKGESSAQSVSTAVADLELPKVNGKTATSELLRLTPEGALLSVHRFAGQVATAVAWDGEAILVGTGYEGELWRFVPGGGARLAVVDAVQVVTIVGQGQALLTQGPAQLLARSDGVGERHRYRIEARGFPRPVRLGRYRVDPPAEGALIRFRAGVSESPDDTWLPWSDWRPAATGVVPLGPARAVQWELELGAGEGSAGGVERVEVAYREVNLPPRITDLKVDEPGVVYLAGPPPSGQVVDVSHPDSSGIFTVLKEEGAAAKEGKKGKRYWRVGYRTVLWTVEDPNEDELRFGLELEDRKGFRLEVRRRLSETGLGVDTTAVPDGWYRFRLTASDAPGNPGEPLEATALTEWFVVDNEAPTVALERHEDQWQVTVEDALSALGRAEWSRDGQRWTGLAPEDGLLDGRRELFRFPAEKGRHLVVVRVVDRHHNRAVAGAVEED